MIEYNGKKFDIIEKFDCHVISLKYKEGGSYFTVIPISPKKYRDKQIGRKWLDSVSVQKLKDKTIFTITDDYGKEYVVKIDNIHKTEIEYALNKAIEYGLMDRYNI